ncbi:MAG: hypothetical protein LBC85_09575 [Fibromonadaceae bacterium]|nr:hypothetical protein [Fibromonadaceae bacterium]
MKNDRDTDKDKQLAFAVFAALTPHRQLHAQKWASPFFGFAHPPPDKRTEKENLQF